MTLRSLGPTFAALGLAGLGLAGCNAPQSPAATPVAATPAPQHVGFNNTPLVTGQYPAGNFDTASPNQSFEPLNSLPPGAANMPVRNR